MINMENRKIHYEATSTQQTLAMLYVLRIREYLGNGDSRQEELTKTIGLRNEGADKNYRSAEGRS